MGYRRANNTRKKGRRLRVKLTGYLMSKGYRDVGWLANFWDMSSDTIRDYKREAIHSEISEKENKKIRKIKERNDINTSDAVKKHYDRKMGNIGCFIATAAYGTEFNEQLDILRDFRDTHLKSNILGRVLVISYYKISPPLASLVARYEILSKAVIRSLDPLVRLLENKSE